jgi:hypothetical protein
MKHLKPILIYILFLSFSQFFAQNKSNFDLSEAYYSITVIDSMTHPYADKKDPEYQLDIIQVSGFMSVETMKFRLERLINYPKTRMECSPDESCPILGGYSHVTKYENADFSIPSYEKKYPVLVHKRSKYMGYVIDPKGNEIFTCTYISSSSGINDLDRISIFIKPYMAPFGMLQPLNPSYVIWTYPTGGLHHATGMGQSYRWDSDKSKLVPDDAPNNIDISATQFVTDRNLNENEKCEPLLILDYKSLDNFLLKGKGQKYSIETKGSFYSYDENYGGEYFRKIEVRLSLNEPYIELAPLEPIQPDDPFELAPLDPVGIAPLEPVVVPEGTFELAPLEPIKN